PGRRRGRRPTGHRLGGGRLDPRSAGGRVAGRGHRQRFVTDQDSSKLGTILGVWAHPDDEAYLSAGIMGAAIEGGQRVVCVTATRGEAGSLDPERWPPETLASIREAELVACFAVLGVREHVWLDYPDG